MTTVYQIAKMIDHSLLRPELTISDVIEGCRLAREYNVASVCVRPCDIEVAKKELEGSEVKVTTVVGFPHGSQEMSVKLYEAQKAIEAGAAELDIVLNIGRLLSKDFTYVEEEIRKITEIAHGKGVIVKVILENCFLTDQLKIKACEICEKIGVDFVKTSTGFGNGGATKEDVLLMRKTCSPHIKVKAAGGIRTLDALLEMRKLGVERVGATATKAILDEAKKRFE